MKSFSVLDHAPTDAHTGDFIARSLVGYLTPVREVEAILIGSSSTLYYAGRSGNEALFVRRDVAIQSARTIVNSSAIVINPSSTTNFSGNFGSSGFSGTSSTVAALIFLPPSTPQDHITGVRELRISVPLAANRNRLVVAGKKLTVLNADGNQIKYRLED